MNFHILAQDLEKKAINVVFHIPIPAIGTNQAGILWRDAIVKDLGGAGNIKSVLPDITTEEDSGLKSGAILEIYDYLRFSSINLTNIERLEQIKARYIILKTSILAEKQIILTWIGYAGNVV